MLLCERGVQSSGTLLAAAQPLARAHLLSHIDRLSQSDGPIDTARIKKLRAGRAGRSDSIPSLIGAAQHGLIEVGLEPWNFWHPEVAPAGLRDALARPEAGRFETP